MERNSGSWYSYYGNLYCFDKHMSEFTLDEIPEDYEEHVEEAFNNLYYGRFRYCHVLLDRRNDPDVFQLCIPFHNDLFEQSPRFAPWEDEVPQVFKVYHYCEILNFVDSMYRDERNNNIDKFLIVVKFGELTRRDDFDDVESASDDDVGGASDDVEIGFVAASKSSIEGLEKVSGLSTECAICFNQEEGKKLDARRMPCGHVFHDQCIQQWLEKSYLCPLCRYAMPIDDDHD